jgi:integrase
LLRHTYAALAVQAGANVKVLQKAMGHSDIRLTLDTCGGLFGDDLDALADRMDEAAFQGASPANGSSMVPLRVAGD